jgi:mannose-6-phosphate isomerase-like protein (cupin superfamily)
MLQKIRRVVTGHNAAGKAVILFDDHAPNVNPLKGWPGAGVTEIWVSDEMPVSNLGSTDRSLRQMRHDPTASGTIFRVVEIPPESAGTKIDASATFGQLGSTHQPSAADSAKHPTMHKTDSIDYLVVISGSMHMLMEEGEVELHAGDCIVQRGTNHAWVNRSGKPCVLAAVLIDAKPAPRTEPAACDEFGGLGREMGARRAGPSGDRLRWCDPFDLSAMGGALARARGQLARPMQVGRSRRDRHDQPAGISRSAVRHLARGPGRGADECQAAWR